MVNAYQFAQQATNGGYIGIPYARLDCQAFVEKVLSDCGTRRNWRGSNHIWREAVHDANPITNYTDIPAGAVVFTVKHDGGEKKRGYNDDRGNACHIGIYTGAERVIHSSTGGVQWGNIREKRWTHYALLNDVSYTDTSVNQCGQCCADCWRNYKKGVIV